ncbi:hypothetical protein QWY86_05815 [Pedobacter aquatilis]|uniref:hypothetical protein n=1 Tax=Pedobacter aquatilis TaxID=351343 RepID=UPI0025B316B0|nr:hypothetical protein [Pedobacter aquatilis]MDN3586173.1 hypothetical protein [Pedobacter aquatilis]
MDENNYEYLKKSLDYLGFGTHLNQVLAEAINRQDVSFSIGFNQRYIPAEFKSDPKRGIDQMHFELRFNRSKMGEAYFLNAMEAKLTRYNSVEPVQKRFELDSRNRISALQAYKLLCGQSFQKDIFVLDLNDVEENKNKRISVWHKLDLKVTDKDGQHPMKLFFPEYGFDLAKTFDRYPIAEMQDMEKREAAIKALLFGNLISLNMELEGKVTSVYLSADPEFKALKVYDEHMIPVRKEQIFSTVDFNQNLPQSFTAGINKNERSEETNAKIKR